jgi:hypothetical protein
LALTWIPTSPTPSRPLLSNHPMALANRSLSHGHCSNTPHQPSISHDQYKRHFTLPLPVLLQP